MIAAQTTPELEPVPPRWVEDALGGEGEGVNVRVAPGVDATVSHDLVLLRTALEQITDLSVQALRSRVTEAYRNLEIGLRTLERKPIRFWNFIPHVGTQM